MNIPTKLYEALKALLDAAIEQVPEIRGTQEAIDAVVAYESQPSIDERAEFEKWAKASGLSLRRMCDVPYLLTPHDTGYEERATQHALAAWQARAALAPAVPESATLHADDLPSALHPATRDLLRRLHVALGAKLLRAQEKYGYSDGWACDNWESECRKELYRHVSKGDPLDVIAYAAFQWHHGWSTAPQGSAVDQLDKLLAAPPCGDAPKAAEPVEYQLRCNGGRWVLCGRETFERGRCDTASHQCEVRALYAAPPADAPTHDEYGWLVERSNEGRIEYRTMRDGEIVWTIDHIEALRFCRREDADRFAAEDPCDVRVCEHGWMKKEVMRSGAPAGNGESQAVGSAPASDTVGADYSEHPLANPSVATADARDAAIRRLVHYAETSLQLLPNEAVCCGAGVQGAYDEPPECCGQPTIGARDSLAEAIAEAKAAMAVRWISAAEALPADGQEVTVRTSHGQIRQIVRDVKYSGGWKQVNCQGWECASHDPAYVTHWRADIVSRPSGSGPKDAPWMIAAIDRAMGAKDGPA